MFNRQKILILVISLLMCLVYTLWISPLKAARIANLKIIDSFISLGCGFHKMPAAGKDILLVVIDDESLRKIDIKWPWPRSVIAEIVEKISALRPAVICVDMVFAGKSVDPAEDMRLVKSFKKCGNVFAAAYFGNDGKYIVPDEAIAEGLKDFGFVNKPRDADNTIRRMRPFMPATAGDILDYSLPLKIASYILNVPPGNLARSVPLSRDGTTYIKFFGNMNRFRSIPVWKIVEGAKDLDELKNKAVFLGVTSEAFHDIYHTPLGMMPGLVIDLNEALSYLSKGFFHYADRNLNLIILFLFVLIAVFGGLRLSVLSGMFLSAASITVFLSLGFFLFLRYIIIDTIGPLLIIVVSTVILHGSRYIMLIVENIVLRKEAITDGLTQLYLYRYFELQLKREMKKARYTRKELALIIYDIDHFKRVNDTYGHEFGNIILKTIAKSLKDHSRKNILIARYGGEEFCIIVSGMKREHVIKYAERLRNMIGNIEFKRDGAEAVRITMSGGIAFIEDATSEEPSNFISAADAALYRSKNSGRDRISV